MRNTKSERSEHVLALITSLGQASIEAADAAALRERPAAADVDPQMVPCTPRDNFLSVMPKSFECDRLRTAAEALWLNNDGDI